MTNKLASKPFVLWLKRREEATGGNFLPGAEIAFTPALRTTGLLASLPAEDLKHLLLVFTFAHANGHIQPTLWELAEALHLREGQMRKHLERLEHFRWENRPLLLRLPRESGVHAYAPSLHLFDVLSQPILPRADSPEPIYKAAGREAVIAHSRAQYARPREEVERDIARMNGWPWPFKTIAEATTEMRDAAAFANAPPSSEPASAERTISTNQLAMTPSVNPIARELKTQMLSLGMPIERADTLLAAYEPERIRRQLAWLPLRRAHNPARLLAAAIEHDYDAPPAAPRRSTLDTDLAAIDLELPH